MTDRNQSSHLRKEIYPVKGIHCASCGAVITRMLGKIPGVSHVNVQSATDEVAVEFDESKTTPSVFERTLSPLGYHLQVPSEVPAVDNAHMDHSHMDHPVSSSQGFEAWTGLTLALLAFAVMIWEIVAMDSVPKAIVHPLHALVSSLVFFGLGRQFMFGVYRFVRFRIADMDTLVGIGTGAAYFYSMALFLFPSLVARFSIPETSYFDVTIVVIGFVRFGKYLETNAKQRTGEAIKHLMKLTVSTAIVVRDGKDEEIDIRDVIAGDQLKVKPGSTIPVDGIVIRGQSFVDESMVTGESAPQEKKTGDEVIGGTLNSTGMFVMRATNVGSQTLLARIITMVKNAQATRAPIEALTDKISGIFVPIVLGLAVLTVIGWLLAGIFYPNGGDSAWVLAFTRAISVLVIACPCALGLAIPTAIVAAIGRGAKEGILIKDAERLERLWESTTIVFDKTGTLTQGKPVVTGIERIQRGMSEHEILSIATTLESASEHPIGKAIQRKAESENIHPSPLSKFNSITGKGITGTIQKHEFRLGNEVFMNDHGISIVPTHNDAHRSDTRLFLAKGKQCIAVIYVGDTVKENASAVVKKLIKMGIKPILLTGDRKDVATVIATSVGIKEVIAGVLPTDKGMYVTDLQKTGKRVIMVGDGVNDAPALASADVGVAMGSGSDAAIGAAAITLIHGDLTKLISAITLAHATKKIIRQNLFWAFSYNIIAIPIAMGALYPFFGIDLNPMIAGVAMAFSSISVVTNSLRLRQVRLDEKDQI